jgi:hypothetical protein
MKRWMSLRCPTMGRVAVACGMALIVSAARGECERYAFLPEDGESDDRLGRAVAVSDEFAIVGAPGDEHAGSGTGSGYVYDVASGELVCKLIAGDGEPYDVFGGAVAIGGDAVIVGAIYGNEDAGAAYIFRYDGSTWTEEAKLLPSNGEEWDHFGHDVAIAGDMAIVCAPGWSDLSYHGAAYVYHRQGTEWAEEAQLVAPDGSVCDRFGKSVSISNDRVVVGAQCNNGDGTCVRSAHVFRLEGSEWVPEQELVAPDGGDEDFDVNAVAISGDVVVIGARSADDNGRLSGSAYVFRHDDEWHFEQELLPDDGTWLDEFGTSVAVSGDTILVGAPREDDTCCDSGSIYVFDFEDTHARWHQWRKLVPSEGEGGAEFGRIAALAGELAVIGAPRSDVQGYDSGAAYLFIVHETDDCTKEKNMLLELDHDGVGGWSNAHEDVFGARRTVLDDFRVPDEEQWSIVRFHSLQIWNMLPPGSGYGFELSFRQDAGGAPGDVFATPEVATYEEIATGRFWFGRAEYRANIGFERAIILTPGWYWFEGTVLGPENSFSMNRRDVIGSEAWVNYEDFGGLQPGSELFNGEYEDLNFAIGGIVLPPCPADFDDDGDVDTADLLFLLGAWGTPDGDVDGDGDTDTADLLALLGAWGDCPE